ncbi:hypothetical protein [Thiohalocapsa sp.]|jgi:hypothetical protein|nr:hypothetical protein [Thiohalocapsa sp.]
MIRADVLPPGDHNKRAGNAGELRHGHTEHGAAGPGQDWVKP